jgi:hypothetical protein
MSAAEAEQLAVCRSEASQAIALLLAVGTWADHGRTAGNGSAGPASPPAAQADDAGRRAPPEPDEIAPAATVLRAAGWHVIGLDAVTPLDAAWEQLPRTAEMLVPGAGFGGHERVTA